jgi:hypothetical protein
MVGKPEAILGLDLFGDQVVNALIFRVGLSETDPPPGRHLIDPKLRPAYSQVTSLRQASSGFVPSWLPDTSGCGFMKGRNALLAATPWVPTHPLDSFRLLLGILGKPALRAVARLTVSATGCTGKDRIDSNTRAGTKPE